MLLIQAHQVTKQYADDWVLQEVSCEIKSRDRIGLVGRNGSGKTTLLNLFIGKEKADRGGVHIQKGLNIGYMEQQFEHLLHFTVDEVINLAFHDLKQQEQNMRKLEVRMSDPALNESQLAAVLKEYDAAMKQFELQDGYEMEAKKLKTCTGLGITETMLSQSFADLSGGEKTKVILAKVLLEQPSLLLLDEPTNHLDVDAIEWLEQFLHNYPGAVLIVSHDRYVLDRVATQIWDVEDGELTVYPGNYSEFVREKEKRLLLQFEQYQEQQKKIKKMQETIKQLREWANQANPPNAGLHRRAASMEKALQRMEKIKRPILERSTIGLSFDADDRSGKDVIRLEKLSKTYADTCLFENIDLQVRYRERIAIIGKNGSGKSTLLRIILGQVQSDLGTVLLGSRTKVGYLSQYGIETDGQQTVIEAFREQVPVEEGKARQLLARFLFYGSAVFGKVQSLSGGEKMRLRLAQLMHQHVNLLILDEPTNHLDIESREVLEEAIQQFDGTVVAISHDRYFLNQVIEKMYWLEHGRLNLYLGNYDEAKRKREQSSRHAEAELNLYRHRPGIAGGGTETNVIRKKRPERSQQKETIEKDIAEIESQLSRLDDQLYQSEDQSPDQLQVWMEEKQELETKREQLYERLEIILSEEETV
ncbi:ribosomal protection-like ABC-F family protein [Paenibacillus tarimensis]